MLSSRRFRISTACFCLVACSAAKAVVVNVPASTLDDVALGQSFTYGALDSNGTSMTVLASAAGIIQPVNFPGQQGLWFGRNHQSATYSFTFSAPIDYFDFRVFGMTTLAASIETIGSFSVNTIAIPTLAFTSFGNTSWNGSTVSSGPLDNGHFRIAISVNPGQSFTSVSFFHFQSGTPNGSVVGDLNYALAVPEPSIISQMLIGCAFLMALLKHRNRKRNSLRS